jgi:catechol 2,3-dioxygenase-like lactoylglutathione lyase family enzyme
MTKIDFEYSHAAILVSDIERSARFYESAVGWEQEFSGTFDESLGRANGIGGPGRILMGKLGGVRLQLVQMEARLERKQRHGHYGLFLCSVSVKDLAPIRERLATARIPIARELDIGRVHLLVVTDPDGQDIGIIGPQQKAQAT